MLKRKFAAVYGAIILVVAIGALATWGLGRMRLESDWVQHTQDVLSAVDGVVLNVASAESSLRAYQVTGDRSYLEPASEMVEATEALLGRLERLTSGDQEQSAPVQALGAAARARLLSIDEATRADPGLPLAPRVSAGTALTVQLREASRDVRAQQELLLRGHLAREGRIGRLLLATMLIGSLGSGLLLLALMRGIRMDLYSRERDRQKLVRQTDALQEQHTLLSRQAEELKLSTEQLQRANQELVITQESANAARSVSEEAALEASRARRMQGRFMAMTTHEIRQPINALLGFAQLLELEVAGPLTSGQRAQVTRIVAGAQHLRTLVDDFLDLSKADAGQLSVDIGPAPVVEAMHSALELVTPQAAAREIRIEVLDSTDCGSYRGDPMRVRQVLVNLLSNAIKYTPTEGLLKMKCHRGTPPLPMQEPVAGVDWICFSVSDQGPGIPPDVLEGIFDPYTQHGEGAHAAGTTGLGLTVSRKLVELMNGALTVESEVGVGSTFSFWLPASSGG